MLFVPTVGGDLAQVGVALAPAFGKQVGCTLLGTVDLEYLSAQQHGFIVIAPFAGSLGTFQHGIDAVPLDLQAEIAQLLLLIERQLVAAACLFAFGLLATGPVFGQQGDDPPHLRFTGGISEGQGFQAHGRLLQEPFSLGVVTGFHGLGAIVEPGESFGLQFLLTDGKFIGELIDGSGTAFPGQTGHRFGLSQGSAVGLVGGCIVDGLLERIYGIIKPRLIAGLHTLNVGGLGERLAAGTVALVLVGHRGRRGSRDGLCGEAGSHAAQGQHAEGQVPAWAAGRRGQGSHSFASCSSLEMIVTVAIR